MGKKINDCCGYSAMNKKCARGGQHAGACVLQGGCVPPTLRRRRRLKLLKLLLFGSCCTANTFATLFAAKIMAESTPATLVPQLAHWQSAAPAEDPSENMRKWMAHFTEPCPFLCCRSVDCATIQCVFCRKTLTSAIGSQPLERYECAECEPVGSESFTTGTVAIVSATTMCRGCFSDGDAAPHRHSDRYLRVDPAGRHSACSRAVPPAPVRELQLADFAPVLNASGVCQCCREEFSVDQPAVAAAFCRKGHGIAATRDAQGKACEPHDTGTFYCGECALQWAAHGGLMLYAAPFLQ